MSRRDFLRDRAKRAMKADDKPTLANLRKEYIDGLWEQAELKKIPHEEYLRTKKNTYPRDMLEVAILFEDRAGYKAMREIIQQREVETYRFQSKAGMSRSTRGSLVPFEYQACWFLRFFGLFSDPFVFRKAQKTIPSAEFKTIMGFADKKDRRQVLTSLIILLKSYHASRAK